MTDVSTDETGLALRPESNGLTLADEQFTPEQKTAIAGFLGIAPENPALIPYLGICARWGLDPVAGQIWLIEQKVKGRDGNPDTYRQKPAVGRDGFLAIARRSPTFKGMEYDTVCANDEFIVTRDRGQINIFHQYAPIPREFAPGEDPQSYRGPLLGAYCLVELEGRKPSYYFAPLNEHVKVGTNKSGDRYYQGAWSYVSAMIIKSAMSMALRLGLGITGVVPVDERRGDDGDADFEVEGGAMPPTVESPPIVGAKDIIIEEGLPEDVEKRLIDAVESENDASPNSWSSAKVRVRLSGRGVKGADLIIEEIERTAGIRKEKAQIEADRKKAETPPETDAELVVAAADLEPGMVFADPDGPDDDERVIEKVAAVEIDEGVVLISTESDRALTFEPGDEVTVLQGE